jgi:N-hydroxyarylamine O-acetyltransferase
VSYSVDLSAYLARIGYSGNPGPNLQTLNDITARHVQSVPFENLDILLGRSISIEPAAIEAKLVHARRGGYCFEHNTLLLHVLEAIGFEATVLSARGRYQLPPGVHRPRTHVLLQVSVEGEKYLVDGGFGGLSPTAALALRLNERQDTPQEAHRIVAIGSWNGLSLRAPDALLVHQALLGDAWQDLFELTLEPMPAADREMGNWYTSTHPASHFRERLMVARATAQGRITLQNRELTVRERGEVRETRLLNSHRELVSVLGELFHLRFADDTRFNCPGLAELR